MFSADVPLRNVKRSRRNIGLQTSFCLVLFLCVSISGIEAVSSRSDLVGNWSIRSPDAAPPALFSPGMAYDNESDRIVLFSGAISPNVVHTGTWAFDKNGNTWENLTTDNTPGGRIAHAMVYDDESDRVILFGGLGELSEDLSTMDWGDTWAYSYNTNTWENMTPETSPRSRSAHNMAYDIESDRVILFGGSFDDTSAPGRRRALSDTWSYDYNTNTWTNMNAVSSPSNLCDFGMAYDSESDRAILHGGKYLDVGNFSSYSTIMHDTWSYDFNTNNWTKMNPPEHPHARERFQMTYHSGADRVVLFGGDAGSDTSIYSDTWIYDYNSNNWTEPELQGGGNHPSKRYYSDMAFDHESDQVILFGGCADQFDEVSNESWSLFIYHSNPIRNIILPLPPIIDFNQVLIVTGGIAAVLIVLVIFRRRRHTK
ncbi:MAG: Kelch repeat-containing protein [Candidatus Thorarchaeota archaeon]|jgi:N-acetylneuraminic acid mutarotase